mmetsp:Transcript_39060/g.82151  ORF Transcript_39060/g.82151 Transcript_39060/m.82151 type:complete len:217 (-) Transcript_39060:329-979(-)
MQFPSLMISNIQRRRRRSSNSNINKQQNQNQSKQKQQHWHHSCITTNNNHNNNNNSNGKKSFTRHSMGFTIIACGFSLVVAMYMYLIAKKRKSNDYHSLSLVSIVGNDLNNGGDDHQTPLLNHALLEDTTDTIGQEEDANNYLPTSGSELSGVGDHQTPLLNDTPLEDATNGSRKEDNNLSPLCRLEENTENDASSLGGHTHGTVHIGDIQLPVHP